MAKFSAAAANKAHEISVRAPARGEIEFAVRDFGPGVPRAESDRVFGLFYRAENALTRATAGTGIGLALVKRLANIMGSRVYVLNREPGAEFCVSLPRRAPVPAALTDSCAAVTSLEDDLH